MKPKVLVTREVFDETLAELARHCEVESNQSDEALSPAELARRAAGKDAHEFAPVATLKLQAAE